MKKNKFIDLKSLFLAMVKKKGGFVNCHAHFDRAFTINQKNLKLSSQLLERKWLLVDKIKRNSTEGDFGNRIEKAIKLMIKQGVKKCASCIDIDSLVELRAIRAAKKIKEKYKSRIEFLIVSQTLKGIINKKERYWLEKSLPLIDIIGSLPSKDRPFLKKHLDILLKICYGIKHEKA